MNWKEIEHQMYTMCMVADEERVLLIKRPDHKGFPGYLAPGGKVDFPESITDAAKREVLEETGLHVRNITFKGWDEYVNPQTNVRYMVFNYLADSFEGCLLEDPPEGELHWVPRNEALALPMQSWFKRKFPLFFEEGTFEIHSVWDEEHDTEGASKTRIFTKEK
ncbi:MULTISPECIES: 8-oxo-dGTP diphosphatase [Cytobacillus]|uniref:8-oxo-dGTP diphosphatase n=1 Tax=Cytobacillus firmus TaxID=1399 RepID=A0AA46SHB0_CYTFI|nr:MULTISPECIES: 8-oxo-dGTP diphosphatase [Cytobacillus]MCC3649641.1 8-oxo-dGTP diphosphatase [Cytobacillus oceanisediminis]MCS0656178.1 8-oxo-dGTP diphosphatase [Cytobacillus firmus]MCU1808537.1 8-oxo-dGTP diphosphatase [Cytobacillus firmus]UYG93264.1 8-oxo-dGTP diphosphatase [Cytobacillus firmus]